MSKDNPRSQNQKAVAEERRARVSQLFRQGKLHCEIAKIVGVNVDTITADVRAIRAEWKENRLEAIDELVDEQNAKLLMAEREAWEAYYRSCQDAEITTEIDSPYGTTTKHEKRGQCGDPRYLKLYLEAIQQRREMLGLDAPKKTDMSLKGSLEYTPPPTREEVAAKLRQLLGRSKSG